MTEPETPPAEADREIEHAATERLVFFSDAVTAIALTLLALELPVPEGDTSREVLRSAREHTGSYLAFLISFLVIASHWRAHHDTFRYVRGVNSLITRLNFGWLLMIVITPFTTQVLSEGELSLARFGTYGVAQAIQSTLFAIMVILIRRDHLLLDERYRELMLGRAQHSLMFACTFGGSVPLFPLLGRGTYALWFTLPMVSGLIWRFRRAQKEASVGRTTR